MSSATSTDRKVLKQTKSRCPVCFESSPATVFLDTDSDGVARVMMERECAIHGSSAYCISSDARFYWLSKGHPDNRDTRGGSAGCCASSVGGGADGALGKNAFPEKNAAFDTLSTCLALIEIVDSCNLRCPTCYADSPHGVGKTLDYVPLAELQHRINGAIEAKGRLEILQLSGGEPTLHPDFFQLLRWTQEHERIDYVLVNTNGVRIAAEEAFAAELAETFDYGGIQLYLQFDGVQESGQKALRGSDLRKIKARALDRCRAMGLPVTLAMTVTPENLDHLWEAVEFGLGYDNVRGISFQPMFFSGRIPQDREAVEALARERLSTADIIVNAVAQSDGKLRFEDFTPLPCGDPNCATIGYLLKVGGAIRSVSDFIDFSKLQDFLHDRIRYRPEDLAKCGCESEPLGEILHRFELDESHTFRLFIKPFMDAFTWDEDRIDRCCTHVIRPDGKLDSFCRYYSGFPDVIDSSSTISSHAGSA